MRPSEGCWQSRIQIQINCVVVVTQAGGRKPRVGWAWPVLGMAKKLQRRSLASHEPCCLTHPTSFRL